MHFCTLKFTMWRFHWKKVQTFIAMFIVHSIRLLANSLAYLSSDVYRSASDYLATVSERAL